MLPTATLKGYDGGAIASTANDSSDPSIFNYEGMSDPATGGVLTLDGTSGGSAGNSGAAAQAPEEGTLLLVFTGLVLGMIVLRKRTDEQTVNELAEDRPECVPGGRAEV